MIETVTVPLGARAYDIRIGPGLLARAGAEIARLARRPRVAILTESRVAALHLATPRSRSSPARAPRAGRRSSGRSNG